jgi:hypothetical protein
MAKRYLTMVEGLRNRGATDIDRLVPSAAPQLPPGRLKDLEALVAKDQAKLKIGPERRAEIDGVVDAFLAQTKSYEVALAMKRILLHRYAVRIACSTPSLFEELDPDPPTPLKADSVLAHGARLHLHHQFDRPLHYGVDDMCDASNENAEVFLQFAGALVANIETRAIRNNQLPLPAREQQSILIEKARSIMDGWAFPHAQRVRDMVDAIGRDCKDKSNLPNAPLGADANAIAILVDEMEGLPQDDELGSVLKHAIANGAITIERNYGQGGKLWALVELTGDGRAGSWPDLQPGRLSPQERQASPPGDRPFRCVGIGKTASRTSTRTSMSSSPTTSWTLGGASCSSRRRGSTLDPAGSRRCSRPRSATGWRPTTSARSAPAPGRPCCDERTRTRRPLKVIVPNCRILQVDVFADDGAPVGGVADCFASGEARCPRRHHRRYP